MVKLERSEALQRKIRRDEVTELAIPDWALIASEIKAGKTDEALDFLEYTRAESQVNNDRLVSFVEMVTTHLAGFGEEEIEKVLRQRYYPRAKDFLSGGIEEVLQMLATALRRHDSNFTVTEEPDRYVARHDPCGSGGRLRRTRSVGTTKKAYPWSWGKAGVPYYCCHCCLCFEIIPIELRGYPITVVLIGDRPEDPCIHLFYKKPELIPEEYFTRVGTKKDMARLKGA